MGLTAMHRQHYSGVGGVDCQLNHYCLGVLVDTAHRHLTLPAPPTRARASARCRTHYCLPRGAHARRLAAATRCTAATPHTWPPPSRPPTRAPPPPHRPTPPLPTAGPPRPPPRPSAHPTRQPSCCCIFASAWAVVRPLVMVLVDFHNRL